MKHIYILSFILICLVLPAFAHTASIKGVVYSKYTNLPLEGATVTIPSLNMVSITDQWGKYKFYGLRAGAYELKISYLGFLQESKTVTVGEIEPAQITSHLETSSLELQEINVSASRDNPLKLISAVDLQVRPIQNAQEILRLIPGLFIAQHAGGGKAEQIFLRGFDIDHGTDINLTADGMPVNMVSHAHGQGYSDLHFLIPETIETVDFGKGPYQADNGNFATAGYADFRTRPALDHNSFKVEAGQFDTYRAVGMLNLLGKQARQNHQNAYIASEYLFSNGYFKAPQHLNRFNIMSRYQGIFREKTILNASVSAFRSNWDASGQIPERAVTTGLINRFGAIDSTEGGHTSRYNVNFRFDKTLNNNDFFKNQFYFVQYNFELYSNFTFFLHDPVNGDQIRQKESRQIYGYQGSYQKALTMLGAPLRTELGVGFRYDAINGSELSRTKNRRLTLAEIQKGDIRELNAFTYINANWDITPRLSLNAALRADRFNFNYQSTKAEDASLAPQQNAGQRLSPKLNITYALSPALQVYVNSGMGYHSNDTRVSVTAAGNETLPVARGTDLGMTFKPAKRLFLNAAVWFLDLDQELVYVGDEGVVEPSGRSRRYGLDVSVRSQLTDHFFFDSDVNLAKPRFRDEPIGNNFVPLAPTLTSTGGLSYQNNKNIKASLRYRYLGHRPANEDYSLTAAGYCLVDAVASYTYKKLEFKVSGENLLNTAWKEAQFATESKLIGETDPVSEIHFTPGTPFFLKAGITYNF